MKIYVITQGDNEDYHIVACTTNYERAKKLTEYHEARLEEYEEAEAVENPLWDVDFDLWENIKSVRKKGFDGEECVKEDKMGFLYCCVRAEDAEEACKIAAEKRKIYRGE